MDKKILIKNLNQSIKSCKNCELWKYKTNYVLGNGSINSKLFFIGEAPGHNEDIKGIPFIGKAGKILDDLLESINLNRNNVYITNILKCRPPKNRNPLVCEINSCIEYLNKELDTIKPFFIITLGSFSTNLIFNKFGLKFEKISQIHGKIYSINSIYGKLYITPQYHPAVAVYNPNKIKTLINDFRIIQNFININ